MTDAWKSWRKVTAVVTHRCLTTRNAWKTQGHMLVTKNEGVRVAQKVSETPRKHQTTVVKPPANVLKRAQRCAFLPKTLETLRMSSRNAPEVTTTTRK